ncbi:glycosyltransferase family protein [Priestia koreensis]|uniref:glycosyltransferase family protein n=1 Tax=Priestia koreensis TaxID=284581 RepID=UPI00345A1DCA
MKIVHGPTEIAGQMGILCKHLRKKGYDVAGYNWFHSYLNYSGDIVSTDAYEIARHLPAIISKGDLFHFHNGDTFLLGGGDLPLIKGAGKKMIMHHWGNDVRTTTNVAKLNSYPLPPSYLTDEEIHQRLVQFSSYIDHVIVQDYEMVPHVKDYYKNVHVLPLACNIENFQASYPSTTNAVPKIIHAPTNREFKGSSYVENAIERLKGDHSFLYQTIEKKSHKEATEMYAQSDIVIDQLLCGTHGMLSVEAMAMGKVVIAYIRDDVKAYLPPDLPIVIATPETIYDVFSALIKDPVRRNQIGIASRAYVEKYHAAEKVVDQLVSIYNTI